MPNTTRNRTCLVAALLSLVAISNVGRAQGPQYDLGVANGRVMDPASGLDAIRHIGVTGGRVVAISDAPLRGRRVIDAANHVVSPGFVDLHEYGQQGSRTE